MLCNELQDYESISQKNQLYKLTDALLDAGYTESEKRSKHSRLVNIVYAADGGDTVFVVTNKPYKSEDCADWLTYCILDSDIYSKYFEDSDRLLNTCVRNDKSYKVIYAEDGTNKPVHRLVVPCADQSVDHISHNAFINTKEMLRPCDNNSNMKNIRFYCKDDLRHMRFSVKDSALDFAAKSVLISRHFEVSHGRLFSPSYASKTDLYGEINSFERNFFKGYNYEPLVDFSKTYYAYVLYRMTGRYSLDDIREYNRDFWVRTDKKMADYYQLY